MKSMILNQHQVALHKEGKLSMVLVKMKPQPEQSGENIWLNAAPYTIGQEVMIREDWKEVFSIGVILYRADVSEEDDFLYSYISWKSSATMPTDFAIRSFVPTGCKAIRLRDLTEEDCKGMINVLDGWDDEIYYRDYSFNYPIPAKNPLYSYQSYYESLHGSGSWAANQDVWFLALFQLS